MGSVGSPEILVILVIALLLFGPQKLPEMGKSLGKAIREFKKATADLQDTIEREVEDLKQDVKEPAKETPRPKGALPSPKPRTVSETAVEEPVGPGAQPEAGDAEATVTAKKDDVIPGPPEGRG